MGVVRDESRTLERTKEKGRRGMGGRPSALFLVAAALAIVLSLAWSGCIEGLRFGPEGEITDPNVLLQRLRERSGACRSFQSEARVSIKSREQSGSVDAFLAARAPDTLRLGILNFFGKPVADVLALEDHFQLHDAEHGVVYVGEPTAENLARLLFVPVSPADAVGSVCGFPPVPEDAKAALTLDRERGAYRLELISQATQETQYLFVDTETLHLLRVEKNSPSGHYGLDLSDYRRLEGGSEGGTDIPFRMQIMLLDGRRDSLGVGVTIVQKNVTLNRHLPARTFEPLLPEGARVIDMGAGAPQRILLPVAPEAESQAQDPSAQSRNQ